MKKTLIAMSLLIFACSYVHSQQVYQLNNQKLSVQVVVKEKTLVSDTISVLPNNYGFKSELLITDADFGIDLVWTGWRAPDMPNNSQDRVMLTKKDFEVVSVNQSGSKIDIDLKGNNSTVIARLTYSLADGDYFIKKNITVRDTVFGYHFLHALHPVKSIIKLQNQKSSNHQLEISEEGSSEFTQVDEISEHNSLVQIIKNGDYGQVVAIRTSNASAFFGMENPATENHIKSAGSHFVLDCSRPYGVNIDSIGVQSEGVVLALNPEPYVRKWYWNYVDKVRVAPDSPYTLYNSWYDLRSVEYPRVPEQHWMNEQNVDRLVDKVHQNMTVDNGIKVDAFVLDDGWDVYKSDWVLRDKQFPNGLSPISKKLGVNKTNLGVWFGPIGGYSFRMQRINWMLQNGYEGIGKEYEYCAAYLCVGGEKYNSMFRNRVTDMINNHGVRYFKWDGMIFSCNDPSHGHRTGLYSTVSVLDEFKKICDEARSASPDVYLNITTGTWLSPWWLGFANQIWMDGADYAFANVPSLSKRDNAITYRDFVLYDDLIKKDLWFPTSNLMTHGLIKGKLDHVGTTNEPIDKLTDDAMLYVARGVSMYELYISPDILTKDEWRVISQSLKWARDRHSVLRRTEMIGGNPTLAEPYGYAHFVDTKGIIALRNPTVEEQTINVELSPEYGLNRFASSLVVEQVYPYRYILPNTYSAGSTIPVRLNGFETAIFEIYPLDSAKRPLVAGIIFDEISSGADYKISVLGAKDKVKILNPEVISNSNWKLPEVQSIVSNNLQMNSYKQQKTKKGTEISFITTVPTTTVDLQLGLLLKNPDGVNVAIPKIQVIVNGKAVEVEVEEQKERWGWRIVNLSSGENSISVIIPDEKGVKPWIGTIDVWAFGFEKQSTQEITIPTTLKPTETPMPPKPWAIGTVKQSQLLKKIEVK